jgi:hypothetical protein
MLKLLSSNEFHLKRLSPFFKSFQLVLVLEQFGRRSRYTATTADSKRGFPFSGLTVHPT